MKSNLWDIVKKVGSSVISNVVPGGSAIIDVVNDFLPNNQKLSGGATGDEVSNVIESLPPEDRILLATKEFEVDLEKIKQSHDTLRVMLDADARSTHTTRPFIAKWSFITVAIVSIMITLIWGYGVISGKTGVISAVTNGWPFITAINLPLVTLLYAYFGVLKTEHKTRMDAMGGNSKPSGILSSIISAIKK